MHARTAASALSGLTRRPETARLLSSTELFTNLRWIFLKHLGNGFVQLLHVFLRVLLVQGALSDPRQIRSLAFTSKMSTIKVPMTFCSGVIPPTAPPIPRMRQAL